jgi:CRP-like cAMP-binding protein
MFLILSGTFQAHIDEHNLDKMEPGELFGEIAFFRESGTRSVSVRCETGGEVLVIRRSLLERLKKESPPDAFAVFEAIAAELAERGARWRSRGT